MQASPGSKRAMHWDDGSDGLDGAHVPSPPSMQQVRDARQANPHPPQALTPCLVTNTHTHTHQQVASKVMQKLAAATAAAPSRRAKLGTAIRRAQPPSVTIDDALRRADRDSDGTVW